MNHLAISGIAPIARLLPLGALRAGLLLIAAMLADPALAGDHASLPAPDVATPFPASVRTGAFVILPPYGGLPVRVYATPDQGPFYNVPPYRVVAPY